MSKANLNNMVELARGHVERGAVRAAEVYYRMILKDTDPPTTGVERVAHSEACVWYARKALHNGRHGEAADWYQRAVLADPLAVDYRVEYCVRALIPMGMHKNARIEAERATRIDPTSKDAWRCLGGMEQALGNAAAAIDAYDAQLRLDPDDPNARLDRATVALDTADYETVRKLCEPVLRTDRRADAFHALAMAQYRLGNHEEAVALYDEAIRDGCYDPSLAQWNKSLALHSIGRYREGWAAHEHRGKQKSDPAMALLMNRFKVPMLEWGDAPCRVHVHQEMGHGDTLAMARYLPMLVDAGFDVCVEVNEAMVSLLANSFPKVKVVPKAIDYPSALGIPAFDKHIPMLSLPAIFGTDVATVPWPGPYLRPREELVRTYQALLESHRVKGGIGLCWSSGIRLDGMWLAEYGKRKSMSFNMIRPITDARFVSLQVGPERKDAHNQIIDLLPARPTWEETAALISCLDMVITVDTSVAHLAGAMGKPVWVMMHTEGSWHWMAERPGASWNTASPWYPSARLFRQKRIHEWASVVAQIARSLDRTEVLVA